MKSIVQVTTLWLCFLLGSIALPVPPYNQHPEKGEKIASCFVIRVLTSYVSRSAATTGPIPNASKRSEQINWAHESTTRAEEVKKQGELSRRVSCRICPSGCEQHYDSDGNKISTTQWADMTRKNAKEAEKQGIEFKYPKLHPC
ncbi:hypothetical protein NA57DRAFT_61847 [Rhizodiscina lignyota]|uniref:Uncharacterized protein n=1 Tax=Rhizodiscina lignyota TaxID=1504668 RepID=A0A9P4I3U6_9PEZI|nr:hypothetical protein NA57DRAFT_61847 [Rhizodiscina lignyota]